MMQRIKNYDKGYCLTDRIAVDKVYPLSILERRQHGELFVDNEDTPRRFFSGVIADSRILRERRMRHSSRK